MQTEVHQADTHIQCPVTSSMAFDWDRNTQESKNWITSQEQLRDNFSNKTNECK